MMLLIRINEKLKKNHDKKPKRGMWVTKSAHEKWLAYHFIDIYYQSCFNDEGYAVNFIVGNNDEFWDWLVWPIFIWKLELLWITRKGKWHLRCLVKLIFEELISSYDL